MNLLWTLIIGAIAGWLAGQITKGRGFGLLVNILLGVVGAFVGSFLLGSLGVYFGGGLIGVLATALVGALVLLLLAGLIKR
jgi:uncharacterized membrane protein YeaQ/YmgE (transglycosylase-associated protein family)